MVIDSDDYGVGANEADQEPVAIINPDNLENEVDQLQDLPKANDREFGLRLARPRVPTPPPSCSPVMLDDAMREILLPPLVEEPKVLEDFTFTWTVESWRSMSKKEHGPLFQVGGYPW